MQFFYYLLAAAHEAKTEKTIFTTELLDLNIVQKLLDYCDDVLVNISPFCYHNQAVPFYYFLIIFLIEINLTATQHIK